MDIINYFSENHDHLFYVIAGVSFMVELTLLGVSGPLMFFAVASFITAVLINFNIISGWEAELFSVGILTGITALILWKPLKKFQNAGGGPDTSSDMIGQQVPVSNEVTAAGGTIRHSGINWNARLLGGSNVESIPEGTMCVIGSVEGNVMLVKPVE